MAWNLDFKRRNGWCVLKVELAERMGRIGTEKAFEVLAKAKELEAQGYVVVHLKIGEPDFDTPENIKENAIEAMKQGKTHYTPSSGIMELRKAIAEKVSRENKVDVAPEEVVVTAGAKQAIFSAIISLVNPGDEVIIPNPTYPIYESIVNFIGGKPVPVPLKEENEFRLLPEDIEERITGKTRMVIVNNPNNPTGSLLTRSDVERMSSLCLENNIYLLADEIYDKIVFRGNKHYSFLYKDEVKENIILINGFSKTYAMTGWRLGYSVSRVEIAEAITKIQINTTSCPVSFCQIAGVEALNGPQEAVSEMVKKYEERRDVVYSEIEEIEKISSVKPPATFYIFPNIKETGMSSLEFSNRLLEEKHVALLAGTDFGEYGEGFIRISFATSIENLRKGLKRISEFLK